MAVEYDQPTDLSGKQEGDHAILTIEETQAAIKRIEERMAEAREQRKGKISPVVDVDVVT